MTGMEKPDFALLAEFEREQLAQRPWSLAAHLDLLDAMVEEAVALKVWPPPASPSDLEPLLRWAKAANVQSAP